MKFLIVAAALFAAGCGSSSSTAPTPTPPTVPVVTVPCDLVGTLPCQKSPAPQPAPAAPATTATLRGTVTDATSGGVLPGITIALSSGAAALSDTAGHYAFTDVPRGQVTITASAASYVTTTKTIALDGDLVIDLVLNRVAAPPAPTPVPSTPAHGGIRSDTITIPHDLIVGTPVQTSTVNTTYCCWPFPVVTPGTYDFTLAQFPMDMLPSGGTSNIVSASEMILAGIRFSQPSTQVTTMTWHRAVFGVDSTFAIVSTGALAHATAFSYVGHFSWEITLPGLYYVVIDTEWGSVTIDFVVR